jgi:hypothetical protein
MELPNDIWTDIVKQSKKTNADIVADMNLKELRMLEMVIAERKSKMYNAIKSKIDKYDIIEVFDDNNNYVKDCVVIDKIAKRDCYIRVCELNNGNKKTIFGNYLNGNMHNEDLCLFTYNIKIKSKYPDRYRENINIANKLKVGDVFCYSLYTGAEWCKLRRRIYEMETLEDGLKYGVVIDKTPNKIVIVFYYKISNADHIVKSIKYINKNMVLNKINYEDNEVEFIKMKKKFAYMCMIEIDKINDNNEYFENVNKKQIINLQKKLKIRY